MFNDTDNGQTQYCPMCEEWARKYEELKQENEQLLKFCDHWENLYNKVKIENDLLKIKIGELSIK